MIIKEGGFFDEKYAYEVLFLFLFLFVSSTCLVGQEIKDRPRDGEGVYAFTAT